MPRKIDTNYMSAECNQLRDVINEIIDEMERGPEVQTAELRPGVVRKGNNMYLLNGRLIKKSEAYLTA